MNVIKYVQKYQDYSFKEKPLNEIDALIFSLISYVDLSSIKKNSTIYEAVVTLGKKIKLKEKFTFNNKNKKLLSLISNTKRYKDVIILDYTKVLTKTTQFGALTLKVPHQFKFIAFEGTDDTLIGWKEDFISSFIYPSEAQVLAKKYLKKHISFKDILVYIGGHSKGGNLAMTSLMESNIFARHRIKYVFNFDGPGFLQNELKRLKPKIKKKIITYLPEESIVGMLLLNDTNKRIIKSKKHNILQHDSYYWEIDNNRFVPDTLSNYSKHINKKINTIINKYSKEKLEIFVNTIFDLLNNSGYMLESDLERINIKKFITTIKNIKKIKQEDKEIAIEIIKALIFGINKEN